MDKQFTVKMICDTNSPCYPQQLEVFYKDKYSIDALGCCSFCKQDLYNILRILNNQTKPKLTLVK